MKVVYPADLSQLANTLGSMGFEMHPMGADIMADAVLYAASPSKAFAVRPSPGGAFLLDVRGMSAAQAAQALRRRAQAPIL